VNIYFFYVFWSGSTKESNPGLPFCFSLIVGETK